MPQNVHAMPPHRLPRSSMVDIAMEGRWEGKGVAVFYLVSELASKSTTTTAAAWLLIVTLGAWGFRD